MVSMNMADYESIDISSIVQIADWPCLDEPLAGSRVKTTVAEPGTTNLYIFKHPKEGREAQIWSELIASYIAGDLLSWPVQHAQIAMRGDQIGNLLKYIYDPSSEEAFIPGEQLCKHVDPNYDPKQGRRHTWDLIHKIRSDFFVSPTTGKNLHVLQAQFQIFWVKMILFDTLISNTDRHAENWALRLKTGSAEIMAPLYDNGSSMGCENTELTLTRKWFDHNDKIIDKKVQSYAEKGQHHLRNGDDRFNFQELAKVVLNDFPAMRVHYEAIINLDLTPVERLMTSIMSMDGLPIAAQMTSRRKDQIMALLHHGQSRVSHCIEEKG